MKSWQSVYLKIHQSLGPLQALRDGKRLALRSYTDRLIKHTCKNKRRRMNVLQTTRYKLHFGFESHYPLARLVFREFQDNFLRFQNVCLPVSQEQRSLLNPDMYKLLYFHFRVKST